MKSYNEVLEYLEEAQKKLMELLTFENSDKVHEAAIAVARAQGTVEAWRSWDADNSGS